MLKCPVPGCEVKIAPKTKGTTRLAQQKNALVNHLKGEGKSLWDKSKGHGFDEDDAKEIARLVGQVCKEVDKAGRAKKTI